MQNRIDNSIRTHTHTIFTWNASPTSQLSGDFFSCFKTRNAPFYFSSKESKQHFSFTRKREIFLQASTKPVLVLSSFVRFFPLLSLASYSSQYLLHISKRRLHDTLFLLSYLRVRAVRWWRWRAAFIVLNVWNGRAWMWYAVVFNLGQSRLSFYFISIRITAAAELIRSFLLWVEVSFVVHNTFYKNSVVSLLFFIRCDPNLFICPQHTQCDESITMRFFPLYSCSQKEWQYGKLYKYR